VDIFDDCYFSLVEVKNILQLSEIGKNSLVHGNEYAGPGQLSEKAQEQQDLKSFPVCHWPSIWEHVGGASIMVGRRISWVAFILYVRL
jgi:hypothetical protein